MNKDQIKTLVKQVITRQLGLSENRYDEDATFRDLGADSLDEIEIIMSFEEETGHEYPDEEVCKITTSKEAEVYLCGKYA